MCRYVYYGPYKTHWACFRCRKMFRRAHFSEWHFSQRRKFLREPVALCPQCGKPMTDMGLDFKPPRKGNEKAWSLLRRLAQKGIRFHSDGDGPGFKPPKSYDFASFMSQHLHEPFHFMPVRRRHRSLKG